MSWLASRGHTITGVELSEIAAAGFFDREPTVTDIDPFRVYASGQVEIYAGDFFDFTPTITGQFDAVYDRAAMIALPEELRGRYVRRIDELLKPGAAVLLITVEYDQSKVVGPPFAVPEHEVMARFAEGYAIEHLERVESGMVPPKFRDVGIEGLVESAYRLTKHVT